jgi:hypothetical protein
LANRYVVRSYTDTITYSRAARVVSTVPTALSGYATPAASYSADFESLGTATPNTVVGPWHIEGRAIAQSNATLAAEMVTPQTDLGSSAATHVSVAFRALTIPFVATQDLVAAPWYLSPEGDIDVRLSRAILTLETSLDGSTWTALAFMGADFSNGQMGEDVVVTARYFRWRVLMSALSVVARNNPDVQEFRGISAIEQLDATYYRA